MRRVVQAVATVFAASAAAASVCGAALPGPVRVAAPAGFYEAVMLEPAASYVARKPITVWCARTTASWHAFLARAPELNSGTHGATRPGSAETYLASEICAPLKLAAAGRPVYFPTLGATIEGLTHEAIHARGAIDEGVTDCAAVREMPRVAVRFFYVRTGAQLVALMAAVRKWRGDDDPVYNRVC